MREMLIRTRTLRTLRRASGSAGAAGSAAAGAAGGAAAAVAVGGTVVGVKGVVVKCVGTTCRVFAEENHAANSSRDILAFKVLSTNDFCEVG